VGDSGRIDTAGGDSGADSAPSDTSGPDTGGTDTARVDLDGDGWSTADGDCDDDDAAMNPDAAEVLDGTDNDCDGVTDDVKAGVDSDASLSAAAGDLGWRGLSIGDLDADGLPEVVASAPTLDRSADAGIYLLEGADYLSFSGDPSLLAETAITLTSAFGYVGERQGDIDGDGDDDLVAIGWNGTPALLVFAGPVAPGALTDADASLTLDTTAGTTEGAVLSDTDPDGDGACGFLVGDPTTGDVRVWTAAPADSVVDPADADAVWSGRPGLGRALAAGDLDGDGADDIAVADYVSGYVHVLPASTVSTSGDASTLASWSFDLQTNVGMYGGLAFGDIDPDGAADIVIGEPFAPANGRAVDGGRVEAFRGPLAPGTYTFADADLVIEGDGMGTIYDFGHHVGVADPFGDGPVILASAPVAGSATSWLFGFDTDVSTVWTNHVLSIEGAVRGDGIGHRFAVEDLDLDGAPEWVVAAPDATSSASGGSLWFFTGR
jgi:hypothetical protein